MKEVRKKKQDAGKQQLVRKVEEDLMAGKQSVEL